MLYCTDMPELPEVETVVRGLHQAAIIGKTIHAVHVSWKNTIAQGHLYISDWQPRKILSLSRRGKWLHFELVDGLHLLVHLKMSGKFALASSSYERAALILEGGIRLSFHDTRKFGKWHFTLEPQNLLGSLGIEPLSEEFNEETLAKLLRNSNKTLKSFLLDQTKIVGLGNIYVDESLWSSQLDPRRRCCSIKQDEIAKLHRAIRFVLEEGIRFGGTSIHNGLANFHQVNGQTGQKQNFLNVYHKEGQPCPQCHTKIEKMILAQRGTHFCPDCQNMR